MMFLKVINRYFIIKRQFVTIIALQLFIITLLLSLGPKLPGSNQVVVMVRAQYVGPNSYPDNRPDHRYNSERYCQGIIYPLRPCYFDPECHAFARYSECVFSEINRQRVCRCLCGYSWNGNQCILVDSDSTDDSCWYGSKYACTSNPIFVVVLIVLGVLLILALFVVVTCAVVTCSRK